MYQEFYQDFRSDYHTLYPPYMDILLGSWTVTPVASPWLLNIVQSEEKKTNMNNPFRAFKRYGSSQVRVHIIQSEQEGQVQDAEGETATPPTHGEAS